MGICLTCSLDAQGQAYKSLHMISASLFVGGNWEQ